MGVKPYVAARFVRVANTVNKQLKQLNKEHDMSTTFKRGTRVKVTTGKGASYKGTVEGRVSKATGPWVTVKTEEHRKGRITVRESEVRAY